MHSWGYCNLCRCAHAIALRGAIAVHVLAAIVVCMLIGCTLELQHNGDRRTVCMQLWSGCCVEVMLHCSGIVLCRIVFSGTHVMPVVCTCIEHNSMRSQLELHCKPLGNASNSTGHAVMRTQVNDRCGGRQLSAPECPTYTATSIKPAGNALRGDRPAGGCLTDLGGGPVARWRVWGGPNPRPLAN